MPSMKIAIVSQYSSPVEYGTYHRHFDLGKELREKGHEVIIVTASHHHFLHRDYTEEGVVSKHSFDSLDTYLIKTKSYEHAHSAVRIINWFLFTIRLFIYRNKVFKDIPTHIIVSSPSLFPFLIGIYYKIVKRSKFVIELRDMWPRTLIEVGKISRFHPLILLMSFVEKAGYYWSDFIISTFPYGNKHVSEKIKKPFRHTCIPQGFDDQYMSNSKPLSNDYIGKYLPSDKFIICYAGTIGLTNSLDTILEASKKLDKMYKDIYFLFVGEGKMKNEYQQKTQNQSNIAFAPRIEKSQVQSLLKKVNIVYDSVNNVPLYDYGISRNKWIDYMFAGKPVLLSCSSKGLSMINESDCGFIVPSENPEALEQEIVRISSISEESLKSIGFKGQKFVKENRTFRVLAEQLESVLLNVK